MDVLPLSPRSTHFSRSDEFTSAHDHIVWDLVVKPRRHGEKTSSKVGESQLTGELSDETLPAWRKVRRGDAQVLYDC